MRTLGTILPVVLLAERRPGNRACDGRQPMLVMVAALAALGACARPDAARPADDRGALSSQWLVGGWVLKGESCESDSGVILRPDGSWHAEGATGTWQVDGSGLAFLLTEAEDDLGDMKRLNPPIRYVERVEVVGADEYVARRDDGSVRHLTRCPRG